MAEKKVGGFKLSFAGSKNLGALKAKSSIPLAKRPRLDLGNDEVDDTSKSQEISGWDTATGGAIDLNGNKKEEKALLVIPSLPNRNWREDARKKQAAKAEENVPIDEGPKVAYGLTIFKSVEQTEEEANAPFEPTTLPEPVDDGLTEEERLDKAAREALQNGKPVEHAVIPAMTEEEAFENDYQDAPEAPSLSAYEATPIDGFGAAMLRGMGWKDGEEIGRNKGAITKQPEIKRRPALLGLGADEKQAAGIELGEWGNAGKAKGKRKKDQTYTPVMLKNKHTGEMVTEEELKKQLEEQDLVAAQEDSKAKSRRSRYQDSGDERDRDAKRDRRRITDGYNENDKRRDRKRNYDDYSEDDRRRDRRYRERRDRDNDRRDRSEGRGERKRDRSRDKDRRRRDEYPSEDEQRSREKRKERDDRRDRDKDRSKEKEHSDDGEERRRDKRRERNRSRSRSRSPDRERDREGDERRKRRKEREYGDEDRGDREERKRRYRDDEKRRH
ncbi:DExH-box splicing factor binding site-domain-containing protein [Dendryphion nanum]|uniref:Pre-mRNA-splicing factor n=1 Tax=Dendryphion nanum TaxID=256645 RepID=A0A9P9E6K6_9PLEO|nr:DExH-box splicing factor binding site-domain-containing protein [Dendryphion nanum]